MYANILLFFLYSKLGNCSCNLCTFRRFLKIRPAEYYLTLDRQGKNLNLEFLSCFIFFWKSSKYIIIFHAFRKVNALLAGKWNHNYIYMVVKDVNDSITTLVCCLKIRPEFCDPPLWMSLRIFRMLVRDQIIVLVEVVPTRFHVSWLCWRGYFGKGGWRLRNI